MEREIITIKINDVTHEGKGVGKYQGIAVFVPFALPGEEISVEVMSKKKSFWEAKIVTIIAPNPERQTPACPYFGQCGGCQLQHATRPEQNSIKTTILQSAMTRIGNVPEESFLPFISAPQEFGYRNKVTYHLEWRGAKLVIGYFGFNSNTLISIDRCLLVPKIFDQISKAFLEIQGKQEKRASFSELTIRQVSNGQIMLLITGSRADTAGAKQITEALAKDYPEIVSFYYVAEHKGLESYYHIGGAEHLTEIIGGLEFQLDAPTFTQVNYQQMQTLYQLALEQAQIGKQDFVLDLYCGMGSITLLAAQKAQIVLGIDSVKAAIGAAQDNAIKNNIHNVSFHSGRVEVELDFLQKHVPKNSIIILDPPRNGCEPRALEAIMALAPKRIVYISCSPSTLARDVKYFQAQGMKVEKVQGVDMFPNTGHVEAVTLLTRSNATR